MRSIKLVVLFTLTLQHAPAVSQWLAGCPGERVAAMAKVRQIQEHWPLRESDAVTRYVRLLGSHLAQIAAAGPGLLWHFNVVRDHSAMAFAVGNGYVYISEGAIMLCQNESELAAILAHEIGHQVAGHFCPDHDSNRSRLATKQKAIGSLSQMLDMEKEAQADRIAVQILQSGGYDPHAMLAISKRLGKQGGAYVHGGERERISALAALLARYPHSRIPDSRQFLQIKRELGRQ